MDGKEKIIEEYAWAIRKKSIKVILVVGIIGVLFSLLAIFGSLKEDNSAALPTSIVFCAIVFGGIIVGFCWRIKHSREIAKSFINEKIKTDPDFVNYTNGEELFKYQTKVENRHQVGNKTIVIKRICKILILYPLILAPFFILNTFVLHFDHKYFMLFSLVILIAGHFIYNAVKKQQLKNTQKMLSIIFKQFNGYKYSCDNSEAQSLPIVTDENSFSITVKDSVEKTNSWKYFEIILKEEFLKGPDEKIFEGGYIKVPIDWGTKCQFYIHDNSDISKQLIPQDFEKAETENVDFNNKFEVLYSLFPGVKESEIFYWLTPQAMEVIYSLNEMIGPSAYLFTEKQLYIFMHNQDLFKIKTVHDADVVRNDIKYIDNIVDTSYKLEKCFKNKL